MKQIHIFGSVAILAVTVFILYVFQKDTTSTSAPDTETVVLGEPAVTIVRTNEGYQPSEVTIKKGDIILWKNESDQYHWPASDLHPTHGAYSEFDPLRPIAPEEDWKFKFDEVGEWRFHDHIRANKVGVVTVLEQSSF